MTHHSEGVLRHTRGLGLVTGVVIISAERSGGNEHEARNDSAGSVVFVRFSRMRHSTTKIEFADGPGPHAFDCEAHATYYQDFNIHTPNEKLRLTGNMQVVAIAEHPDRHWRSGISVYLRVEPEDPLVGLAGRVYPEVSPDKIWFSLRWSHKPSDETPAFVTVEITIPCANCNGKLLPQWFYCPICGHPNPTPPVPYREPDPPNAEGKTE